MDAICHETNDVSRTAKSCGPGAPTLALSPRMLSHHAGDGGKQARFTEEITYKPLKPLRRECRLFRLNLWFCRVLFYCTRTMGAAGTRHSLRPLHAMRAV